MPPPHGGGGVGHAREPPISITSLAHLHWKRTFSAFTRDEEEVSVSLPIPAGRPGFEGEEPSLPAPKSPTLSGQGTVNPARSSATGGVDKAGVP